MQSYSWESWVPEPNKEIEDDEFAWLDLDTIEDVDAERLQADVTRAEYNAFVNNSLPYLRDMTETLTSPGFKQDIAQKSESLVARANKNANSMVNAQRGRMGLGVPTLNTSDQLKQTAAKVSGYNQGVRSATDIQNQLMT